MPVTVQWGTDRFQFELPPPDTPLSAIRQAIAEHTRLPYHAFHIVHDGAQFKDDNAPISLYHLRNNSTIAVVAADTPVARNTEHAQIAAIHAELTALAADILPAHHQLLAALQASHNRPPPLTKERTRVSELLLQALLRVDAIVPEPDWAAARSQRKSAVKQIQSLLDQLDSA